MAPDQSGSEQGIFPESPNNQALIEKAVHIGLLSAPHQFNTSKFEEKIERETVISQSFFVEKEPAGLNLNLMILDAASSLDGRLVAATIQPSTDSTDSTEEPKEELFIFPLLKNERRGVDIVFPPDSAGNLISKGRIRVPLMTIPMEFLHEPNIENVIKTSILGLSKSPKITEAWKKFVEISNASEKEIPLKVKKILKELLDL